MCQQQETLPAGVTAAPFACRRGALTLRGVEYRPAGTALPIAIVCHGFMQNLDTVRHYARALAGAGWLAYCFDFSGGCAEGCRSDGATTDMSALTEVEDLQAVLAWAASRPYADSGRVLLMGCSMGGFVSALTAAKLGARVQKLVLFYPALCIPDDARAGQMMLSSAVADFTGAVTVASLNPSSAVTHTLPPLTKNWQPFRLGRESSVAQQKDVLFITLFKSAASMTKLFSLISVLILGKSSAGRVCMYDWESA